MYDKVMPGIVVDLLIQDIKARHLTGILHCKITEDIHKKLFFSAGRLASATSSLIDDRLGEIIYKRGQITAEQVFHTVGKVTPTCKFGAVLIKEGYFKSIDLWDALNNQTYEIIFSVALYDEVVFSFEQAEYIAINDTAVHFNLSELFMRAKVLKENLKIFDLLARRAPLLEIQAFSNVKLSNDYYIDLLSLVEEQPDYNYIVNEGSRLNKQYTIRALYDLFSWGVIKDSFGFVGLALDDITLKYIKNIVENGNYMYAEIKHFAEQEGVEDFNAIIDGTEDYLTRDLGSGFFIEAEGGFIVINIIRAVITQEHARIKASNRGYKLWPNGVSSFLSDVIFGAVLYMFYELVNRCFGSSNLKKLKITLDEMRSFDA